MIHTIERDQLIALYEKELWVQPTISAETFACVSEGWFFGTFGPLLAENLRGLEVSYVKGIYECRQFTRLCRAMADLCHLRAWKTRQEDTPKCPLAVGGFGYTVYNIQTGHNAANAIGWTPEGFKMFFLEPQSGKRLGIWDAEKQTCMEAEI